MYRSLTLCAAAGLVVAGLFVASPAQASYRIIKWPITNICQIWDYNLPTRPFPPNYMVVSGPLPSLAAALHVKDLLWRRGVCLL